MPFIDSGEASEANRQFLAQMQALAEFLMQLAELASQTKDQDQEHDQEQTDAILSDPSDLLEGDALADSLVQDSEQTLIHDAVNRLAQGRENGLVYQAEGFSVFRHTEPTNTIYEVTTPDGDPLLIFEQVGSDLHLIDDHLSPDLKESLLNARSQLAENDLSAVLRYPDPCSVISVMGEAAPAGTRAAWVTQQMLRERDSFTPNNSNFRFDRDQATGNLTVTDRTNNHVLLSVTPLGKVTCTMSAEQLAEFRPAYDRLQSFQTQAQVAAKNLKSKSCSGSQQLTLER